jgi:hypothetical protein
MIHMNICLGNRLGELANGEMLDCQPDTGVVANATLPFMLNRA